MTLTKDKLLTNCHPEGDISWNEFMNDCETAINTPELHSDECTKILCKKKEIMGKDPSAYTIRIQ
jgi:hypothetical protein